MTLALLPPTDARRSEGTGCGQISSGVPLETERSLVRAFSDAGARLTNEAGAEWSLSVSLTTATVGAQYQGSPNQSARPTGEPHPDAPDIVGIQGSLFNSDNGHAIVTLESTLSHRGGLVWAGTVSGHADSVPCQRVQQKVREALGDAIDTLRARVISEIRRSGP